MALLAQPLLETAALGQGADQAAIRGIAAPQDAIADIEIERVAVRHHEVVAGRRHGRDLERGLAGFDGPDVAGLGAEDAAAAVDPADVAVQPGEQADERGADVPGAEHGDIEIAGHDGLVERAVFQRRRAALQVAARFVDDAGIAVALVDAEYAVGRDDELGPRAGVRDQHRRPPLAVQRAQVAQPFGQAAAHGLEQHVHHAAAALPERRAERETARRRRARVQQAGGDVGALVFELAPADRADGLAGGHDHLRPGLAGRRSADAGDRDQHGRLAGGSQVR